METLQKKYSSGLSVVLRAFNLSTAETDRSLLSLTAGQPGLQNNTVSRKEKEKVHTQSHSYN